MRQKVFQVISILQASIINFDLKLAKKKAPYYFVIQSRKRLSMHRNFITTQGNQSPQSWNRNQSLYDQASFYHRQPISNELISYSNDMGMRNQLNQQSHFNTEFELSNVDMQKSGYGNYSYPSTYQSENFSWNQSNNNEHPFSTSYRGHNESREINYFQQSPQYHQNTTQYHQNTTQYHQNTTQLPKHQPHYIQNSRFHPFPSADYPRTEDNQFFNKSYGVMNAFNQPKRINKPYPNINIVQQNHYIPRHIQPTISFNHSISNDNLFHRRTYNQKGNDPSFYDMSYQQKNSEAQFIHFDKQATKQLAPKSDTELLVDEVHQVNLLVEQFLAQDSQGFRLDKGAFDEFIERVIVMGQLINQNYKLYQESDQRNQQVYQEQTLTKHSSNIYNHHFHHQKTSHKQHHTSINFKTLQIIDYQQQFSLIKTINNHFMGEYTQPQQEIYNPQISYTNVDTLSTSIQIFSRQECLNVFVQLVVEIQKFRHFKYLLIERVGNQKRGRVNSLSLIGEESAPLLITSILWHLQTLRVLITAYDNEATHFLKTTPQQPSIHTDSQILITIRLQLISLFTSLEQLMAKFLQQVMIQTQTKYENSKEELNQKVWFFYYQYPEFNHQWICLLLDTILQFQMKVGSIESLLEIVGTQKFPKENILQNQHGNLDSVGTFPQSLTNPKSQKKTKRTKPKPQTNLSPQVINNLLSILLFLLFPHSHDTHSPQFNPINLLLEQPVKKIVFKEMKKYQKKIQTFQQENQSNQIRKSLIIRKFLIIDKISNVVSFFTNKLTESKIKIQPKSQNNFDQNPDKLKRKPVRNKKSYLLKTQAEWKNPDQYQLNYLNCEMNRPLQLAEFEHIQKRKISFENIYIKNSDQVQVSEREKQFSNQQKSNFEEQKFSIQLKIMEMTLFVRQMGDILLSDCIEPLQIQDLSNQSQLGVFFKVNEWMSKLSIKSMLGLFFQKIIYRKKLAS